MLTGAGSGVGYALTRRLVDLGCDVFAGVIDETEHTRLNEAFAGESVTPILIDVRDDASVEDAAAQVATALRGRPLKALLNVAGVIWNGPLIDMSAKAFEQLLAVNLLGVHRTTVAFLPLLRVGSGATIVNMSSQSGARTMPFAVGYSASKFGLEALTNGMRLEFAPFDIRVCVVAPGLVHTPMADRIAADLDTPPSDPVFREPLKRFRHRTVQGIAKGIPMSRVVATFVHILETDRPKPRYSLQQDVLRDLVLMTLLPAWLREILVRRALAL